MMTAAFNDKLALITGVTSGIGQATARALIERGARVLGVARDAQKLDDARSTFGDRFVPIQADLARPEQRQRAIEKLRDLQPTIDVFISNAAEAAYDSPLSVPIERLQRLFEVNVLGAVELVQAAAPFMRPGAHLLQLSSVTAKFMPGPRFAAYGVTKLAVEQLTNALRLELEPRGVHVSVIVPGLVNTPIYDSVEGFDGTRAKLNEQVPRWLAPEDVADAMLWILSRPAHVVVSELTLLPAGQTR